jgi:glycosyltransferase involved in cell wall biosynthesis
MTESKALARPRIGIDGFNLAMPRGTGIATYARVLSRCLTEMGHPVDVLYGLQVPRGTGPEAAEILFFDRLGQPDRRAPKPIISKRWWQERQDGWRGCQAEIMPMTGLVDRRGLRMPAFDRILNVPELYAAAWRYFRRTGRFLRVRAPDAPPIMHWTYPLPILLEGARNIYTIHDLVPLRLPHTTLDNKAQHLALIRGCIAVGAAICTVSEASRADILRLFPQAEGRVHNTYETYEPPAETLPQGDALAAYLRGVFGLAPQGYFLFFGSLEPKKNIGRLLEAYLSAGTAAPLVVVGAQAWKSEQELSLLKLHAQAPPGGAQVRMIEYLPFGTLLRLIGGARAVLFPSLAEGFGLPVLEAMALGTPVLTSTEGALPEIAGDCALLVDPYDVPAIARGIRELDTSDALRARLASGGPARAALFGAAAYQLRLAALYAAACGPAYAKSL